MIGLGIRGSLLLERLYSGNKDTATVMAVCDAYTGNLTKAAARIATLGGNNPKHYSDYRELLQDKSIDAVIIATPEHLHCTMLIDALAAGKHVYIEKPLAHTIEEGEKILHAAEHSKQVVQAGMQNRSNSLYAKAKEMVEQGMIGEVHYTRAFWYRNSPDDAPAWRYAIPADANEHNTDWARFLGDAPKRPFSKPRFYQWRLYWDYSGGIATDLLVHQTDITQFVLGKPAPLSCMSSGATLPLRLCALARKKTSVTKESHWRGHRHRSTSEVCGSNQRITQSMNGLEEDDHAKSPGRKEAEAYPHARSLEFQGRSPWL